MRDLFDRRICYFDATLGSTIVWYVRKECEEVKGDPAAGNGAPGA